MKLTQQIKLYKHSLQQNALAIIEMLTPYKRKNNSHSIAVHYDDFIQVLSRIKLQNSKLQEFFLILEEETLENGQSQKKKKYSQSLSPRQVTQLSNQFCEISSRLEQSTSVVQNTFNIEVMNSKHSIRNAFKSLKLSAAANLTQTENDVMEGLFTLGKLVQTPHFLEGNNTSTELTQICNNAVSKLEKGFPFLSPIQHNYEDPPQTPVSCDDKNKNTNLDWESKIQTQQEQSKENDRSRINIHQGDWDSKLDSNRDQSKIEIDRLREAFKVLEQADVLTPENMQLLAKCSTESNKADKEIFLELFLQVLRAQKKSTSKRVTQEEHSSFILREQVLQIPTQQDFSFESPLPSLREEPKKIPVLRHVQLEDLLKIQQIDDLQLQEGLEDNVTSQNRKRSVNTPPLHRMSNRKKNTLASRNDDQSQQSFYSQKNFYKNIRRCTQRNSHGNIQADISFYGQRNPFLIKENMIQNPSRKNSLKQLTNIKTEQTSFRAQKKSQSNSELFLRSQSSPTVPQEFLKFR